MTYIQEISSSWVPVHPFNGNCSKSEAGFLILRFNNLSRKFTSDEEMPILVELCNFLTKGVLQAQSVGRESICIDVDCSNLKVKRLTLSLVQKAGSLLSQLFENRLGLLRLWNTPKSIRILMDMINPFIDNVTRRKLYFTEEPMPETLEARNNQHSFTEWYN